MESRPQKCAQERLGGAALLVAGALSLLFAQTVTAQAPRIRGTNASYAPGDWITYPVLRYVQAAALGDQHVYFGTTGGVARFDRFRNRWDYPLTVSNGLADDNILCVAYDVSTGLLWCATSVSVAYLEPSSQVWTNFFYDEVGCPSADRVVSIGFARRQVWLETQENHLLVGDPSGFAPAAEDPPEEVVWFGARAPRPKLPHLFAEVGLFYDARGLLQDVNLRQFPITCWVDDPWQVLWIGSWGLGAGRGDLKSYRLTMLPIGLCQRDARVVARQGKEFWIGGGDEDQMPGVTLWDGADSWSYFEPRLLMGFRSARVNSIAPCPQEVWLGTDQGLVWFDRARQLWKTFGKTELLPDERVNDVLVDSLYVWAATRRGVTRYLRSSLRTDSLVAQLVQWPALGDVAVYDLARTQNLIWMGTEYGIYVYDCAGDSGGFYSAPEGPLSRPVTAVASCGQEVWFGTPETVEGFDMRSRSWFRPPARLLQTGGRVNRIAADTSAVWATTDNGVLKYDRKRKRWRLFTVEDGLPSNEVFSVCLDGDYVWFGTRRGLTRFYWNSPYRID
ncbi:MAG: ligand-binding sensor domain-containing protein [Candidatus Oleimicrobiaceae bacterium]